MRTCARYPTPRWKRHGLWPLLAACCCAAGIAEGAEPLPAQGPEQGQGGQAPTNAATLSTNGLAEADQAARAYLRLQEQLHTTLLAIERARQETSDQTRTTALAQAVRLESLEKAIEQQRDQQLQSLHQANRTTLVAAGTVVGVGLLALAATALLQRRRRNRYNDLVPGSLVGEHALLSAHVSSPLDSGQPLLLESGSRNAPNKALLATIQRLEERVRELELEQNAPLDSALERPGRINGDHESRDGTELRSTRRAPDRISVLLGKGQVLLNLGQPEGALVCYEQILAQTPGHAEAHLKRGNALERLKRLDEAVAAYDRALTLNQGLTEAYLGKATVSNQQERYSDALECYERALRSEARP